MLYVRRRGREVIFGIDGRTGFDFVGLMVAWESIGAGSGSGSGSRRALRVLGRGVTSMESVTSSTTEGLLKCTLLFGERGGVLSSSSGSSGMLGTVPELEPPTTL